MIKAVIIDDELNARELLEKTLVKYFPNRFNIVAKCDSVDAGVMAIKNYEPQLVFLDIQMPEKNGFELFKSFEAINFEVIFTTAHNQFAIKAIKRSALDYLLKPINHMDLAEAVKKFEKKNAGNFAQKKLALLLENLNVNDQNVSKIAFPTTDGFELIHTNQILYCKAESNYCCIKKIEGSTKLAAKTLKFVEEILPTNTFKRIHKSYVINLNYVVRYHKANKEIELTNGEKLPVSFRKEEEFINAILQNQ
ncbi:response regulator transcription factor [Antarcticibacterium flavum]|uniref:Response regulator transcription factor n=1 Tax=Antarcticibacterium flavum TaxID=2058175 RepID=A0A5B7X309_9FLAO|nr:MULTISPECIES: LytTR family DNA-binding domain-containing protein [Antarcticibacterium]MCM4161298.1 DNA-binding response regulator [Antarcticibacterium sp. W02-3]QCY69082.1 response regulator transcription factor [Antarcticibacterium flavum]